MGKINHLREIEKLVEKKMEEKTINPLQKIGKYNKTKYIFKLMTKLFKMRSEYKNFSCKFKEEGVLSNERNYGIALHEMKSTIELFMKETKTDPFFSERNMFVIYMYEIGVSISKYDDMMRKGRKNFLLKKYEYDTINE